MLMLVPGRGMFLPKLCERSPEAAAYIFNLVGKINGVNLEKNTGSVFIPADPRLLELLASWGKGFLCADEQVRAWYRSEIRAEAMRARLILAESHPLSHPRATDLFPFQTVGASFIAQNQRVLLADDCGLGKTVQIVVGVEENGPPEDVLVLCPNSVKYWWQTEQRGWTAFPNSPAVVFESKTRRTQQQEFGGGWAIVNYEQFRSDEWYWKRHWKWLIIDEAHNLKNRKTQLFDKIKRTSFEGIILATGTPMGNDPSELWALLHLLYPEKYTSYWRFYELYVDYTEDFWGSRHVTGARNPKLLRRDLASRMIQRRREAVLHELPERTEQEIPLVMLPKQEAYYRSVVLKMLLTLDDGTELRVRNTMSKIMRLR